MAFAVIFAINMFDVDDAGRLRRSMHFVRGRPAVISVEPDDRPANPDAATPAEGFAARLFLGPALRAQPDRRLVTLVRDGYETAFEEIVRRYGKPLDRYAAAIVGARAEDVTQDAFSKALLALRGADEEIELRPWLYRIVRNTALNDLRDRPPRAAELAEAIDGGRSPPPRPSGARRSPS